MSSSAHPSYARLALLTLEAVLEVVVICIGGYIAAKRGLLTIDAQKVIANLNMLVFTPALIFSKLAGSLTLDKFDDLAIIPILFALMTLVSMGFCLISVRVAKLNKRDGNFCMAMAVFGNSNSLPISLTLSLSYTLDGLYWDKIENDTREQIASRGILYLLIFQQLGQFLRWTWGYNQLLASAPSDEVYEGGISGRVDEENPLLVDSDFESGGQSPDHSSPSSPSFQVRGGDITSFPRPHSNSSPKMPLTLRIRNRLVTIGKGVWEFMNAPLWAMLASLIVATIPALQHLFFDEGSFINNSVTSAIRSAGNVAIPLILVVLGSNLAREADDSANVSKDSTKIVLVSLFSRMVFPALLLAPLIAVFARYVPISLFDDPIFIIVVLLLIGAPSAIQLAQICQINGVYEHEMSRVLFWSYVVLTLPSTLILVVLGIEVVHWVT